MLVVIAVIAAVIVNVWLWVWVLRNDPSDRWNS